MQSASRLLGKIIKTYGSEHLVLYLKISDNWKYIVGDDLLSSTSLHSMNKNALIINVISSSAILVKNKESIILDRVNGMSNNAHLFTKIIIKHCMQIEKTNEAA